MKKLAVKCFWIMRVRAMGKKCPLTGLPLKHFSWIVTWSSYSSSPCFLSPPSSASSAFLLAYRLIPTLPQASFNFKSLLFPPKAISAGCSLCPILSLSSIPSTHSLHYCQKRIIFPKNKSIITPLLTFLQGLPTAAI